MDSLSSAPLNFIFQTTPSPVQHHSHSSHHSSSSPIAEGHSPKMVVKSEPHMENGPQQQKASRKMPEKVTTKGGAPKMIFRCEICTADSIYHYYGVQSCEGCKQFFRRIIVKQKDFKCWKTQKCDIEKGERCRSCRLDKCLMMGMNPRMVNIRKTPQLEHFVGLMEKRRLNLFENNRSHKTQNEADETGKMSATKFMVEITSPKAFATSTTPPNQLEMATASRQQNLGIYPQMPSISATFVAKGRKCKSCRLQMCKIAGMVYHKMEESSSEGIEYDNESFNDNEPMSSSPNLGRLAKTYVQFLAAQRAMLKDLYPKNAPSNGEFMTVPFEHMHAHFQQETKQMLIWMFKKNFSSIGQKQHLDTRKMLETTIDACFGHLNLLSACYLTLKHLPARTDNRFFTAYGHLVIMDDRLDTILCQMALNASNSSKYYNAQKRMMDKKFMFVQNLRNVKIKIQRDDFTVLMAIIFCIKASSAGNACMGTAGIWEQYKETIMAEWFQGLKKRFRSTKEATIQIAWLLSLLTPLDMIFTSCQETMEFPSIPFDNPTPTSNVFIDKMNMESKELAYLLRIASAHEKVRSFYHQIPHFDLNDKYDRLESLLESNDNFLALESLKYRSKRDAEQVYSEIERNKQHPANTHPRVRQSVIFHRLLAIGYLKAMPIFRQLTSEEQSILTQNMFSPLIFFTNFYYSVKMGARTLAGPDGVATINIFRIRWGHDNCVMALAEKTFTRGVAKFGNIPLLDEEEFALLLAILCTHSSAIPRLSDAARNLLYAEQSHYSGLLMRHLQRKLGFQEGAKRYADCIDLIEVGFYADHKLDLMRTYLESVRGAPNGCFIPPEYPKCLLTLKP